MSLEETRLDDLLIRTWYRRAPGKGSAEEVWINYYSRARQANHQCFIGSVSEILKLNDNAVKQLIEIETYELDKKIWPTIEPLSL